MSHKIEIIRLKNGDAIPQELSFSAPLTSRLVTISTALGDITAIELAYITMKLNRVK